MKITICGSIAFYDEMLRAQQQLEAAGHIVQIPELKEEVIEYGEGKKINFASYVEAHGGIDSFPVGHEIWDIKESAIHDHFGKIEWSDAILVTNYEKRGVPGYVGGNTLMEMGLASYLKKPLYLLNEVSPELSYKVEILGMKPILLSGALENLK